MGGGDAYRIDLLRNGKNLQYKKFLVFSCVSLSQMHEDTTSNCLLLTYRETVSILLNFKQYLR